MIFNLSGRLERTQFNIGGSPIEAVNRFCYLGFDFCPSGTVSHGINTLSDKAKKAMIDAARLADELRAEQENAQHCEKNRRSLECQVKDMQTKLDEAEQQAVKGGRKVTSRLEQKIKDLESQFDDEQRRLVEAEKSHRRTTRRIKELTFSQEEDHKVTLKE